MTTNRKNTKKTKSSPTYTLSEFKTWLDGYCSAHPSGWSPTPEQWKLISKKLFSIVENETIPEQYVLPPNQPPPYQPVSIYQPSIPTPVPVTSYDRTSSTAPSGQLLNALASKDPSVPMRVRNKDANDTTSDFC